MGNSETTDKLFACESIGRETVFFTGVKTRNNMGRSVPPFVEAYELVLSLKKELNRGVECGWTFNGDHQWFDAVSAPTRLAAIVRGMESLDRFLVRYGSKVWFRTEKAARDYARVQAANLRSQEDRDRALGVTVGLYGCSYFGAGGADGGPTTVVNARPYGDQRNGFVAGPEGWAPVNPELPAGVVLEGGDEINGGRYWSEAWIYDPGRGHYKTGTGWRAATESEVIALKTEQTE